MINVDAIKLFSEDSNILSFSLQSPPSHLIFRTTSSACADVETLKQLDQPSTNSQTLNTKKAFNIVSLHKEK